MSVNVIVGEQRGDEGKGRYVDMLAEEAEVVGRGGGGHNAGHTIVTEEGLKLDVHIIPSGIAYDHIKNVIGRGCVLEMVQLDKESETIRSKGFPVSPNNLLIDSAAHLILPHHVSIDQVREAGNGRQGSTQSGISPTASAKYGRRTEEALRAEVINNDIDNLHKTIVRNLQSQVRVRELLGLEYMDPALHAERYVESALKFAAYITDAALYVNRSVREGKRVLVEGAQAFWLDPDHGMWPAVTSTSTTALGVMNGLGVPTRHVDNIYGVSKLVQSHVGGGPFVTEITDEALLDDLHGDMDAGDAEKGTTTGRVRRLGYLDLPAIRRAQMFNDTTAMAVTKLDWVPRFGNTIKVCTSYNRKGKDLLVSPDAAYKLEQSEPQYTELPNWTEDISNVRRFEDLPKAAQAYLEFIETQLDKHIALIGVGPGRDQVIDRRSRR